MGNPVTRNDSDGIWLSRELEKIEAREFDREYADIIYSKILPVNTTTVDPAADKYTYRMRDKVGKFKVIQDRVTDIPRVDVTRREVSQKVVSIAGAYGYTVAEIRAARREGITLEESRVSAVRRAAEEEIQRVALFGDTATGLEGFLNNASVDALNVTDSWFSNGSTADEMLRILNTAVRYMVDGTNMAETPNGILLAYEDFAILNETPRSSTSDTTVLEYFLRNDRYIQFIEPINELKGLAGSGRNKMVVYKRDPMKSELMLPQPLEFFPPEREKLEYEVISHARVMGATIRYPKSVLYVNEAV